MKEIKHDVEESKTIDIRNDLLGKIKNVIYFQVKYFTFIVLIKRESYILIEKWSKMTFIKRKERARTCLKVSKKEEKK